MKKNKCKSWLIKVLHKWLKRIDPEYYNLRVEHTTVPLVTLNASVVVPESAPMSAERINEILARQLSDEVIKYATVEWCDRYDSWIPETVYRATVRVAADKRG